MPAGAAGLAGPAGSSPWARARSSRFLTEAAAQLCPPRGVVSRIASFSPCSYIPDNLRTFV